MPKIIFFDIDNTIWDYNTIIPESTKRAIHRLHENGHLAFLCTGRARGNLRSEELFRLPFDGIIASCGNHVEYRGIVLHERILPEDELRYCIEVLSGYGLPSVLEGPKDHWIDEEGFETDPYVDYLYQALGEDAHPLRGYEPGMRVNKISSLILPSTDFPAIEKALGDRMEIIHHPGKVVEIIPKGTSKASGIQWICDYLGIDLRDVYAVGDSSNDLEMLTYVEHSIAMGNATEQIKEIAEYVTTDLHSDGIWNAMKHYGLL